MVFRSIRARFTGWYLLILAVLLVGLAVSVHSFLSLTLQRTQDDALRKRAEQLAGARETRQALNEGVVDEGLGELIAFFRQEGDGFQVTSARLVENDVDLEWIDQALAGAPGFYTTQRGDGTQLRFYVSRLLPPPIPPPSDDAQERLAMPPIPDENGAAPIDSGAPVVIVVGQPMDRTVAALAELRRLLLIAIPLTLILSAGGGLFLVRRTLRPIDRMIETTRGIEETDLSSRVAYGSDDELGRLARTLNAMLGRLERSFHRQRQFTDDASHELRSPLSVIEAEATLALRRERDAIEYRDSLSVIAEEAGTMNRLIDQLLALARGDAGEDALIPQPVRLPDLISETVAAMLPLAEEKAIRLSAEIESLEAPKLRVMGDDIGLRRVLVNLLENAIRYTSENGEIVVAAGLQDDAIVWTVQDSGEGISKEHLAHVFERFYRADKTRSRRSGGSGLGLAICRQIIDAHKGTISVESELSIGTTFVVRLPML